jgi:hypothetical protein
MLRDIINVYDSPFSFDFDKQLEGIASFPFESYTSSAWAQVGAALAAQFFDC